MAWTSELAEAWAAQNLGQNMKAGGGAIIEEARRQGKMDTLQAAMDYYNNPNQGGAVPMTLEQLHQYERESLQEMARPPAYGKGSIGQANEYLQAMINRPTINPMAEQYLQQAGEMVRGGSAPLTMQEVEELRNPYAQALQDRLTQQGERARAEILARQGRRGSASFGDTATGEEMGFLQEELGRQRSDVDFKTYESAFDRLQRQRELQARGGSAMGQLGSAAQGLTASGAGIGLQTSGALFGQGMGMTDLGRTINQDRLRSGQYIRGYNQQLADLMASDILGQQRYEPQQLATIQSLLDIYQSGTGQTMTPGANTLQQLGGLATAGGALVNWGNQQAPRPSSGFVGPMPSNFGVMF